MYKNNDDNKNSSYQLSFNFYKQNNQESTYENNLNLEKNIIDMKTYREHIEWRREWEITEMIWNMVEENCKKHGW